MMNKYLQSKTYKAKILIKSYLNKVSQKAKASFGQSDEIKLSKNFSP